MSSRPEAKALEEWLEYLSLHPSRSSNLQENLI